MITIDKIIDALKHPRDHRPEPIDLVDIDVLRELYNKIEGFEVQRVAFTLLLLYVQGFGDIDNVEMVARSKFDDIQQVLRWLNESTGI